MKKIITTIIAAGLCFTAFAQKDTLVVKTNNVTFETETSISKTGNTKVDYIAKYNGEYYISDKTSYKRYMTAKRYNVIPNYALVVDEKSKAKKFIVL